MTNLPITTATRGSARRWLLASALLFFSAATLGNSPATIVDQSLKQRLVEALAQTTEGVDRFDAEVWLVDMMQRLRERLKKRPDSEEFLLTLLQQVHLEARRAQLSPELVLAVIQVESNFDRFAISEAGARGLMQVMPFWLDEIGRPEDDLFDIRTNLRMGCTILRHYLEREKGNRVRALARYNGSVGKTWYPQLIFKALARRWYRQ
jgi:soluble lytic murein transglycosylase-like protein